MKNSLVLCSAIVLAGAGSALADPDGPHGPHYNLTIHGVPREKTANMTGGNAHRIFVPLDSAAAKMKGKIYLSRGEFRVCDGNAFDAAYDCDGVRIASAGAVFQLPCNTNIVGENGEEIIPCTEGESSAYEVWANTLGAPGGHGTMQTCATDPDTGEDVCSNELLLLVRNPGRPEYKNVTKYLTSMLADIDGDGDVERVALFAGGLEDWFWEFDNHGIKLVQLRFYELE